MTQAFRIIETLRYEGAPQRLETHLARLRRTCDTLGVPYDETRILPLFEALGPAPLRLRLTLDQAGVPELTSAPLTQTSPLWRVAISSDRLTSTDPWLQVKTTNRALYDTTRAHLPDGVDEMVFLNERGELCEGTITNIFLKRGAQFLTPPLSSGLLPGVLRAEMLALGEAVEAVLRPKDLETGQLYLGNSLRGMIAAELIQRD